MDCVAAFARQRPTAADDGSTDRNRCGSSGKEDRSASRSGAYEYQTDGTTLTRSSEKELIASGHRSTPSCPCEGHPWRLPRMESRWLGNLQVRFGERGAETTCREAGRRCAPTLLFLSGRTIATSMVVVRPGAIGPAPLGAGTTWKAAGDGFFASRCKAEGGGKKLAADVAGRRARRSRSSVRPCQSRARMERPF